MKKIQIQDSNLLSNSDSRAFLRTCFANPGVPAPARPRIDLQSPMAKVSYEPVGIQTDFFGVTDGISPRVTTSSVTMSAQPKSRVS